MGAQESSEVVPVCLHTVMVFCWHCFSFFDALLEVIQVYTEEAPHALAFEEEADEGVN